MNYDTDAELLEKVVETIDTYGHLKGNYGSTERGFCLYGAVMFVDSESTQAISWNLKLQHHFKEVVDVGGVVAYNDNNEWSDIRDFLLGRAKDLRNDSTV